MEWQDEGIVIGVKRHGETSAIVSLLTRDHGRHGGLVRGAYGKRLRGTLQPGNKLHTSWRARLEEHLGSYTVELISSNAAPLLREPGKLAALTSACALIEEGFPEREPHPGLFDVFSSLMIALDHEGWAATYVKWEMAVLAELGFGLDLSQCAATGVVEDLHYISPKSGRAVSKEAGEPYKDKLLILPPFLLGEGAAEYRDLVDGMRLTGYFLSRHLFAVHDKPMPDARIRLLDWLRKRM